MSIFGAAIDVRPLFPRERQAMVGLLRTLSPADWAKPTVCPGWDVHDIAGHVANDYLRRLSGSRDGYGGAVFADDETLPAYLTRTNEEFVRATRQLSPYVLIDLLEHLGTQLDAMWAARDLDAPADLNVSCGPAPPSAPCSRSRSGSCSPSAPWPCTPIRQGNGSRSRLPLARTTDASRPDRMDRVDRMDRA
ncbi:maleylpyruvate isomerase N-terminal domain-containing protein [Spongiactinospora gelatinilytica]|uniref:maleylpyruvate isomerase N-terminal domain-containing protein n=1 Tax=Spongiactinospora gelatinilytica TaxID=2666298 RepID=UPI0018F46EA0|nr:maleylpyruvate isomerase N-terminal domain-containing protein [Spongiactinospora gelatinilytica]